MAKFSIKITMSDDSLVDDVAAIFPDEAIAPMISACEKMGYIDADGYLIKGGRAVTYALRVYLTQVLDKAMTAQAAALAAEQAKAQVEVVKNAISIEDNMPPPVVPDQPVE